MVNLFHGTEALEDIARILVQMDANCPHPSSTSRDLWRLRRATDIASHNRAPETMLEKAVAMLANKGHLPEWFNQCPTASGIGDSSRNRHSNIDLVHWKEAHGRARLIELKWASNTPFHAVRQLLRYGAAYVFCRIHRNRLPVSHAPVMNAREVHLQILAPAQYYTNSNLRGFVLRAREHLKRFKSRSAMTEFSMSLGLLAFPEWFDDVPFANGQEVRAECDCADLTEAGRQICSVFNSLVLQLHIERRCGPLVP